MLSATDIKEQISLCYIRTIAAKCACSLEETKVDRDSIDCVVKYNKGKGPYTSPELHIQAKATSVAKVSKSHLIFPKFSQKNYNDLRKMTHHPRILVVLALPHQDKDFVKWSSYRTSIKRCAYWLSLKEYPDITTKTTTLKIPIQNCFSPNVLMKMLENNSFDRCVTYGL